MIFLISIVILLFCYKGISFFEKGRETEAVMCVCIGFILGAILLNYMD